MASSTSAGIPVPAAVSLVFHAPPPAAHYRGSYVQSRPCSRHQSGQLKFRQRASEPPDRHARPQRPERPPNTAAPPWPPGWPLCPPRPGRGTGPAESLPGGLLGLGRPALSSFDSCLEEELLHRGLRLQGGNAPVPDEQVAPAMPFGIDGTGHCEHRPPQVGRLVGRLHRPAGDRPFDHQNGVAQSGQQPVAVGKRPPRGRRARGKLAHDQALPPRCVRRGRDAAPDTPRPPRSRAPPRSSLPRPERPRAPGRRCRGPSR